MNSTAISELKKIVRAGLCVSCGACAALDRSGNTKMVDSPCGPIPRFGGRSDFSTDPLKYCPGISIDYFSLYHSHYGSLPKNWLLGHFKQLYVGFSSEKELRLKASSGGVISTVLRYLLETKQVDGVILAKQGVPQAHLSRHVLISDPQEIVSCAQSIYHPVSMLDILPDLDCNKKYAITLLPEAAAVLRKMQKDKIPAAEAIKYVIGPYTGTQIYPNALSYFYRALKIKSADELEHVYWRAGEWPGYLEMKSKTGNTIRSRKIYYNFLIPFYITLGSLLSVDFTNEFCDLSVGDAWSPKYETLGAGFSVVAVRSAAMMAIISQMQKNGLLNLDSTTWEEASSMHGHMLDFKKRGSFIRIKFRKLIGKRVPEYTLAPKHIPLSRYLIELVNVALFSVASSSTSRFILKFLPESVLGYWFNKLRLFWKGISKPTKRKGLLHYQMKRV